MVFDCVKGKNKFKEKHARVSKKTIRKQKISVIIQFRFRMMHFFFKNNIAGVGNNECNYSEEYPVYTYLSISYCRGIYAS